MNKKMFDKVVAFDNYEIVKYEPGDVQLQTVVQEESLNIYNNAHGGFLFTLCDSLAGAVGVSLGSYCVTQQASINYVRKVPSQATLLIKGKCIHNGKHTKVVQVEIYHEKLVAQATYTMYVMSDANKEKEAI